VERVLRLLSRAFPRPDFASWQRCELLLPHALEGARHREVWQVETGEAGLLLYHTSWYLRQRARYAEALPLYQRALSIREQVLGPDHPDVAFPLYGLARVYLLLERYEAALPVFERALSLDEQALGPDHPSVAFDLNSLADLARCQGRYADALSLGERALAIREQALGPGHQEVAQSLVTLGELARDQHQDEEARLLFERALAIQEQALGSTHPSVAESLAHLGRLLERQSHLEEALPLLERALVIWEQTAPEHPNTFACRETLATLLLRLGRDAEAILLEARAQVQRQAPPAAS
jgi:tetratricopeptide (TPR) repeat protein